MYSDSILSLQSYRKHSSHVIKMKLEPDNCMKSISTYYRAINTPMLSQTKHLTKHLVCLW